MKLTFIRANHEVTGSCTMLEVGGHLGLVDCGMEQGRDVFENIPIPAAANALEFVLVTHAHLDHTGLLPLLYKEGFRGTVYATQATCDLCDIMLKDSAHIQLSEAEWKSRKARRAGQPDVEPIYDLEDVEGLLKLLRPCPYGEQIQVEEGLVIRFTDVGHLLGSACIEAWLSEGGTEKKIIFSGDVGNTDQPILNDPRIPEGADYVMIESTYGDRLHERTIDYVPALAAVIQRTLDRGGNVIIPSFAIGRTQEMLYFLRQIKNDELVKHHPGFPVYVDSPLATEATGIFLQTDTQYLDEDVQAMIRRGENPLWFDDLRIATSQQESQALNDDKTPKVILSASGMCDAGRVRHHLKYNLWRPECTVLFVGYQAVGRRGQEREALRRRGGRPRGDHGAARHQRPRRQAGPDRLARRDHAEAAEGLREPRRRRRDQGVRKDAARRISVRRLCALHSRSRSRSRRASAASRARSATRSAVWSRRARRSPPSSRRARAARTRCWPASPRRSKS